MSTHNHVEKKSAPDIASEGVSEELQPRQFESSSTLSSTDSTPNGNDWQTKLNQTERLGHSFSQVSIQPAADQAASHQSTTFPLLIQPKVVTEEQQRDAKRETMMRGGTVQ